MEMIASYRPVQVRSRLMMLSGLVLAALLAFSALAAPKAQAELEIEAFDVAMIDEVGGPYTQAGGHPFAMSTTFELATEPDVQNTPVPKGGAMRHVVVDLPEGLVGNPTAVPTCPSEVFTVESFLAGDMCPVGSQVGYVALFWSNLDIDDPKRFHVQISSVHNLEAPHGVPARIGFPTPSPMVSINAAVRDEDRGITMRGTNLSQGLNITGNKIVIWGTPGDPRHDDRRCVGGHEILDPFNPDSSFNPFILPECPGPEGTHLAPHPFPEEIPVEPYLTTPTRCTGPLETTIRIVSWEGHEDVASQLSHDRGVLRFDGDHANPGNPLGLEGCDDVPFNPTIEFEPTNTTADKPTGATVQVSLPQGGLLDPEGIATAHLKDTEVTLPAGMAINPSAANGLDSCSPQDIGLVSKDPVRFDSEDPRCPDASKVGTVRIETPLQDDDLTGDVYVAEQGNNPFDSTFAIYVVAKSERHGVTIKLSGEVAPDSATGRIKTTFDDAPQLPFSTFTLRFKGGERAPLVNPPTCGTKSVRGDFVPWSATDPDNPTTAEIRTRTDSFEITRAPNGLPCASSLTERPFDLGMSSGLVSPIAGSSSPFSLRITRPDGHQEIRSLSVSTPEGLTAILTGIPMCSEAQAEAGNCPAASKVGTAITGAGSGNRPVFVTSGEVFLTGPYNGAPLGLLVQVPAAHGPFDLGMVNVRSALHVDPRTAQVRVESDPIPQILEGVPLRVRDIRIQMDRENFTLAPTNCQPKEVLAQARGSHGGSASLSNHFQVGECAALDFAPRFGMRILNPGRRSTLRSFNPAMRFGVAPRPGHANIGRAAVTLPRSIILDQSNIRTVCTRDQFAADECPEAAIYGFARAWSPLLDDPVQGPVYLGSSPNPLPDLIADLHGQVRVSLQGRIVGTRDGRMRNIFDVVPDVPVERFQLTMFGGRDRGVLVNSTDLCRTPNRGVANFHGQNGKRQVTRPAVGLTFRGCKQVRQRIARRHAQRRAAIRQAVRQGRLTPAQARRAIRR